MEREGTQPGSVRVIDGVRDGAVANVWEAARQAWAESPQEGKDEALAAALGACAETNPGLLPDVFRRGMAADRPVAEQKAFARQLGLLARHEPRDAETAYRGILTREDRKPGLVTAALEGAGVVREVDPETFAMMVADTLSRFEEGSAEWRKARSLLFDGSHSGAAAVEPITAGLRSERKEVRRMTGLRLLPELAQKKQYGTTVLDLIEERLDVDDDQVAVRNCVARLPAVYERRPGQARTLVDKALAHPHESVRDTVVRVFLQAGMKDKLPVSLFVQ